MWKVYESLLDAIISGKTIIGSWGWIWAIIIAIFIFFIKLSNDPTVEGFKTKTVKYGAKSEDDKKKNPFLTFVIIVIFSITILVVYFVR